MQGEEVDFDFFDTPRDKSYESPKSKPFPRDSKPPVHSHRQKHEGQNNDFRNNGAEKNGRDGYKKMEKEDQDDYSSSDFDSNSDTPRNVGQNRARTSPRERNSKRPDDYSLTESSSAYSNSEYSSDEDISPSSVQKKKETISVHMPKAQEAWSKCLDDENENNNRTNTSKFRDRKSSESDSSDIDSDIEEQTKHKRNERIKSAAQTRDKQTKRRNGTLRSSGSFSNNSDITDVSPLDSPEGSPRTRRKNRKHNGQTEKVQYKDTDSTDHAPADIKLETEEIDLSILMKCMADIDREKQERLKANSRRVMFAPPAVSEKKKGNYTFSDNRARMIEKENQRLLKQIMMQMHSGSNKRVDDGVPKGPKKPKKATEPVVQRLTPSAVNRMREQRRIEAENMVTVMIRFFFPFILVIFVLEAF